MRCQPKSPAQGRAKQLRRLDRSLPRPSSAPRLLRAPAAPLRPLALPPQPPLRPRRQALRRPPVPRLPLLVLPPPAPRMPLPQALPLLPRRAPRLLPPPASATFVLGRRSVLADRRLFLYILLFRLRFWHGPGGRQLLEAGARPRLDARGLTDAIAQVVQTRAANAADARDFDLLDKRREVRKHALDADAVGDAADRERGSRPAAADADDDALEDLDALPFALDDLGMNADGSRPAGSPECSGSA